MSVHPVMYSLDEPTLAVIALQANDYLGANVGSPSTSQIVSKYAFVEPTLSAFVRLWSDNLLK